MVPQGRDDLDYPGIACLVREPEATAAHASRDRLRLADEAGCFDLAVDMAESVRARTSPEKALLHQIAAAHATAMKLLGRAQDELARNNRVDGHGRRLDHLEAVRLSNAAERRRARELLRAVRELTAALRCGPYSRPEQQSRATTEPGSITSRLAHSIVGFARRWSGRRHHRGQLVGKLAEDRSRFGGLGDTRGEPAASLVGDRRVLTPSTAGRQVCAAPRRRR